LARVRFVLFASYWMGWTALFLAPLAVFALAGAPTRPIRAATRLWSRGILFGLRHIIGLDYVEEGREHIPTDPCLFVANHQSAWETLAFLVLVPDVAIIAKRELLAIPVVGWFLRRSPMIVIDRANGTQALRTMIEGCQEAVAAGRSVLIFPEGTRGGMADPVRFKRGVELLYGKLGLKVVPVAVNSGLFWPGGASARPGTVVVSYLAAIAPGLPSAEFLRGTETAIDRELDRWRTAEPAEAPAGL
jgi:1-acyl-sn-glycerol-3-phosphate acyltransferase